MSSFTKPQMLSLLSEFLGREVTMEECKQAELDQTEQWYASGMTDFSVYAHEKSLLACASYTVSQSLVHVERPTSYLRDHGFRVPVKNVVDHGCGLGLTTLRLGQLYPRARVLGTNVPGVQMEFNRFLLSKFSPRNVEFIDEQRLEKVKQIPDRVYLLCLEVFEHFKKPLVELRYLVSLLRPVLFVESSSFNLRCTGHFDEYNFGEEVIPGVSSTKGNLRLSKEFRNLGYDKQPRIPFQPRPRIWVPRQRSKRFWGNLGTPPNAVYYEVPRFPYNSGVLAVVRNWRRKGGVGNLNGNCATLKNE